MADHYPRSNGDQRRGQNQVRRPNSRNQVNRGRGGGRGSNRGGDGPSSSGSLPPQHNAQPQVDGANGSGDVAQNNQQRNNRNRETERKGPIFGFKRLHGFLTKSTEEVIMSIDKDVGAFQEFLESDELTSKGDNLLILVIQILGEKICTDVTDLPRHQMDILIKTNTPKFVAKITEKCQKILLGVNMGECNPRRNMNSDFVELDTTPSTFLKNLHQYCLFMSKKMPDTAVDQLLAIVGTAFGAVTVISTGDPSLQTLMQNFQDLRLQIQSLIKKREEPLQKVTRQRRFGFSNEEEEELHNMEAPNDYRDMSIVPSAAELLSKEEVFLRPNKTKGAYNDAKHYLDVQFRLLREDFVQPLKKGIQDFRRNRFEYLSKKKKIPLGTIRIYRDVQVINVELVRDVSVYKVQLCEDDYKRIKWDRSKRLLTGSLVVFTSDDFQTAYFAVVANRNTEELSKGIASITWEGNQPVWDKDDEYLMVECEVYFEAYRYTLQILKELQLETFPMCKFIVNASSEVGPPKYLEESESMLKLKLKTHETIYISSMLDEQWPTPDSLGLDTNQFDAFKAALTKEFAIIQGPPGTGKTFLGLKIAKTLLKNQAVWRSQDTGPILVVCYTNHALDQFLEGILEVCPKMVKEYQSVVRVGGRSKSDILQDFTLANVIRRNNRNMPRDYWTNRNDALDRIQTLRYERSSAMAAVMGLRNIQGIINFEGLEIYNDLSIEFPKAVWNNLLNPKWLGLTDGLFELSEDKQDQLLSNWFTIRPVSKGRIKKTAAAASVSSNNCQNNTPNQNNEPDEDFDEDYDVDELLENRILDDIYAEAETRGPINIEINMKYIPEYSIKDCEKKIRELSSRLTKLHTAQNKGPQTPSNLLDTQRAIDKAFWLTTSRKNFLSKIFALYKDDMIDFPDIQQTMEALKTLPADLAQGRLQAIGKSERWALFFEVVERARALSAQRAADFEKQLIHEQKKLQDIQRYGEGHILRNSQVVGMTTTGAAKYHDLVKMMQSKIVIVEEAAEVLESHIVTCITPMCQHLILIGDHRQLKPSTTVYDLSTKYNLDTSLFERMLNNKLNCYQLKVQHRMRPEIANLVVGTIYEELNNHPSVTLYEQVLGVTKNLFFITHKELEKSETDSMSKSNLYEAKFLAGLCRYLVLQGYATDRITVLTTYTGQMFLLKKTINNFPNCKGVRITVVDNFQGEENDIILLSLVRSNAESKIGFLNIENRVCVALSRAKHGLFIIGNMSVLASKSKIWSQIEEKLVERGECGPSLMLECQNHGTFSEVKSDNDFSVKVPEGGCNLICDTELKCTHKCMKICHIKDRDHLEYRCQMPCLKRCANDHLCKDQCCKRCPPCGVHMKKTLPCQHEKNMPCFQKIEDVKCMVQLEKTLPCGHKEEMACHIDTMNYTCRIEVEKELPCGHKKILRCYVDPALETCKVIVKKTLIPCGHEQDVECRFKPDMIKCDTLVGKKFANCGHEMEVRCADANQSLNCRNRCTSRLLCGHACTKLCHVSEDPDHLTYICKKDCAKACPEGHKCGSKHKCHLQCPPCKIEVERKLECGHLGKMECRVKTEYYECLKPCDKKLKCWHTCANLCFQPCGPCQIEEKKRIPECGHPINLPCCVQPSQDMCETQVKPLRQSECSHDTTVPCKISKTASPIEVMENCIHPCGMVFSEEDGGCGHTCGGTCKSCFQGRFHEKCQEECGKSLVCGHRCEFPCSKSCPPCNKQCLMKCEHSECTQKCGTPCRGCSEKCPWQCPHKECTKLCRDMCDRDPCDEPCPKMLKCNHPCIGFCGEPCPPQCRICDKEELTEFILYGNEEDEDARFVLLPDCKHAIEVEGLTYHMNLDYEGQIGTKCCPRCKTVIRHCRRFGNIMRARLSDVVVIKEKVFGNQAVVKQYQNQLIPKLRWDEGDKWTRTFPTLQEYLLDNLVIMSKAKKNGQDNRMLPKAIDEYTITSIKQIADFAEQAIEVALKAKADLTVELYQDLLKRYRELFANVMTRKLPLSRMEIQNISHELHRLFDLNQVYLRASVPNFIGHARAPPIYKKLLKIVLSHEPYTHKSEQNLRILLNELEDVLKTGLGITDNEKDQIVSAMGMTQGHWFKCPNGHIYVITECGGAMEESECNECGAKIGGGSHALRRDNQIATEMDGATRPAWPGGMQHY